MSSTINTAEHKENAEHMQKIKVRLSNDEIDLINVHRAMLRCGSWSDYLRTIASFPSITESFSAGRPGADARDFTFTIDEDVYELVKRVKTNALLSWRDFLLEPITKDQTIDLVQVFNDRTAYIMREGAPPLWDINNMPRVPLDNTAPDEERTPE